MLDNNSYIVIAFTTRNLSKIYNLNYNCSKLRFAIY